MIKFPRRNPHTKNVAAKFRKPAKYVCDLTWSQILVTWHDLHWVVTWLDSRIGCDLTWLDLQLPALTWDLTWDLLSMTRDLTWTCKKWLAYISAMCLHLIQGLTTHSCAFKSWHPTVSSLSHRVSVQWFWAVKVKTQLRKSDVNRTSQAKAQGEGEEEGTATHWNLVMLIIGYIALSFLTCSLRPTLFPNNSGQL